MVNTQQSAFKKKFMILWFQVIQITIKWRYIMWHYYQIGHEEIVCKMDPMSANRSTSRVEQIFVVARTRHRKLCSKFILLDNPWIHRYGGKSKILVWIKIFFIQWPVLCCKQLLCRRIFFEQTKERQIMISFWKDKHIPRKISSNLYRKNI